MLTNYEKEMLFQLIEKITGSYQSGPIKKDILISQVENVLQKHNIKKLNQFLIQAQSDESLFEELISSITNHTTHWFREEQHFQFLEREVKKLYSSGQKKFSIWSCASSTGEEVYSIALVMEQIKNEHPDLEYEILGTDIDSISIDHARRAIFKESDLSQIPKIYQPQILFGTKKRKGFFTLKPALRARCKFRTLNLLDREGLPSFEKFDFIFCRNVLIYFHISRAKKIVERLATHLNDGGKIYLGLTESMTEKLIGLSGIGHSCYEKKKTEVAKAKRLLVIDDVPVMRIPIKLAFQKAGFEVLEAGSAFEASEQLSKQNFDFITLDLQMPGKDGISWLREFRAEGYTTPVVIISGSSEEEANLVYGALGSGAQDYIEKDRLMSEMARLVSLAVEMTSSPSEIPNVSTIVPAKFWDDGHLVPELIVIGASTGGPDALWRMLSRFPKPSPPILIVQHTSAFFARQFAETIERASGLSLGSCKPGEILLENHFYVSLGDYHIGTFLTEKGPALKVDDGPAINGHRPSVNFLFDSVANCRIPSLGIILTGMGQDGSSGMLKMQQSGVCFNLAQDAESCVVNGMPKSAIDAKAVNFIGNIDAIRKKVESLLQRSNRAKSA